MLSLNSKSRSTWKADHEDALLPQTRDCSTNVCRRPGEKGNLSVRCYQEIRIIDTTWSTCPKCNAGPRNLYCFHADCQQSESMRFGNTGKVVAEMQRHTIKVCKISLHFLKSQLHPILGVCTHEDRLLCSRSRLKVQKYKYTNVSLFGTFYLNGKMSIHIYTRVHINWPIAQSPLILETTQTLTFHSSLIKMT